MASEEPPPLLGMGATTTKADDYDVGAVPGSSERMVESSGKRPQRPALAEASSFGSNSPASVATGISSSTDLTTLPTEFRLQLQVLERVSQQGLQLQRLADQQQAAVTQLTSLTQLTRAVEGRLEKQMADNFTTTMSELKQLAKHQVESLESLKSKDRAGSIIKDCLANGFGRSVSGSFNQGQSDLEKDNGLTFDGVCVDASCLDADARAGQEAHELAATLPSELSRSRAYKINECRVQPRKLARRFVTSVRFEGMCAFVIMFNAITIGISAQYAVRRAMDPTEEPSPAVKSFLRLMTYVFMSFYVMEAALKIFALRKEYFFGLDWRWNIFDFALVCTAISEILSDLLGSEGFAGQNMTWLRLFRLLKMLKMLRVVRVMRFFRELRMMLTSIIGSFGTLMWSMLMLSLLTYVFGLCFLNAVTGYLEDLHGEQVPEETMFLIQEYWSSVHQSTITLYMAVTGGSDWEPLAKPIRQTGEFYYLLFLFYIAFSMVAVLNVLTGMFVDTALKVAETDDNIVYTELTERDAPYIEVFRSHLLSLDIDGRRVIEWDDLYATITAPAVRNFLKALDIDAATLNRIFKMLVDHERGVSAVDIEEFIAACGKIHGDCKGVEMLALTQDTKRYMAQMSYLMQYVEERFMEMHDFFEGMGAPTSHVTPLGDRLKSNRLLPVQWAVDNRPSRAKRHTQRCSQSCGDIPD